jgi:glucokinase
VTKSFSIGVDLGGTNLRVAAFTSDYSLLDSLSMPTRVSEGPEQVARDIVAGVQKLLRENRGNGNLQGVGVGTPGPLELPAGRLREPPNLPGFDGFGLKAVLEEQLQMDVLVESDANAAALAECLSGVGRDRGETSLCMLTLGTGVGGGLVLEGRIWHGMSGMAGEPGHSPIFPDGPACSCGGRGCLELYASATGLRRMAAERASDGRAPDIQRVLVEATNNTVAALAQLAEAGHTEARALFREMGRALGLGLANLVNALNLPVYALGGGVAGAWNLFAPAMMETVREYSYVYRLTEPQSTNSFETGKTQIVPARLGSGAGLLGAAMLPYAQQP